MRNRFSILVFEFSILVLIDQITKLIFSARDFFMGPLHVHLMKNYGLAFSLNFGAVINFVLVGLGLIFFAYYYFKHRQEFKSLTSFGFVLIFAGAISNIADRLLLGYVRDFIDISLGFTFNLADAFVAAGLIIILIFQSKADLEN
jgi:signal peptidase II